MRRRLVLLWKWSLLITLPVSLVFFSWASSTWRRYENFALRYDTGPIGPAIRTCHGATIGARG